MNRQLRRHQQKQKIKPAGGEVTMAQVRAWDLPWYRQQVANNNKCDRRFAFVTYGGLGDVLCAEPTIRYACEVLRGPLSIESITVITRFPDLFSHLDVDKLGTNKDGKVEIDDGPEKYHFLYCGHPEGNLQHSFFTHNSMLPVDYPALSSIRSQLPLEYRTVKAPMSETGIVRDKNFVYVHAGAHWDSKRFPKTWWDEVLNNLANLGLIPVLIGGPPTYNQDNPGTIDVNASGCKDLRGKLSLKESAEHLHKAHVLLTNDSFPLHLATIGEAHVGFLATAKDPEWLMHYRKNSDNGVEFGWRMKNLALGGAYQRSFAESQSSNALSRATPEELNSWLPNPKEVAAWAASRT